MNQNDGKPPYGRDGANPHGASPWPQDSGQPQQQPGYPQHQAGQYGQPQHPAGHGQPQHQGHGHWHQGYGQPSPGHGQTWQGGQQPPGQQSPQSQQSAPGAQWQQQPAPQAWQQTPQGGQQPPAGHGPEWAGAAGLPAASSSGPSGTNFFQISVKRAFRLRIDPHEVLPDERVALASAVPPIVDPEVQAFLTWRRSLLFVIAVMMVPIMIMAGVDTFRAADEAANTPGMDTLSTLQMLNFLVGVGFTITLWLILKKWTQWRKQRRILFIAWLIYFLAPFLVYLYPLRAIVPPENKELALLVGMIGSIAAFIELAPGAISLMPGLVRASIVSKLLFPGAAAPGWLMVLTTPIYGLLIYVVLLAPFQMTGSGFFIAAIFGLIGAQVWLARAGYRLAKPMSQADALLQIRKARGGYLAANLLGLLFICVALADLVSAFNLSVLGVIQSVASLFAKVLLLTVVATDIMLVALDRARGFAGDPQAAELRATYDQRLSSFMGSEHADS